MITLLLHVLRLLPFLFGGHRQLAVENLALRQQLAVYKRTTARPKLRTTDRLSFAKTSAGGQVVDLSVMTRALSELDDHVYAPPLRLLPFLVGGHCQLALENLALRQQLDVYKRTMARPPLRRTDRLFWVVLARVWTGWRRPLVIVTPNTVLRWQRRRFREYWTKLSARPTRGRPPVSAEIKALVSRMVAANPLWGAPRIHAELLKLGIDLAERTVSRLMPKHRPRPSQTWRTFLANHVRDLVSLDFFTVPTADLRVLFVLCRARSPSAARRTLQRDRTPHRPMDGPADRGRLPG